MLAPLQRFVVITRHNPKEPPDYWGPFISRSKAEEFAATFPDEKRIFVRQLKPRQDRDDES